MMSLLLQKMMKSAFFKLVLVFLATYFLLFTAPGLQLIVKSASFFLSGSLNIDTLQGRMIDTLSFEKLHYSNQNATLTIPKGEVHWEWDLLNPEARLKGTISAPLALLSVKGNIIEIHQFKGQFSGHSPKTITFHATFTGKMHQKPLKGQIHYQAGTLQSHISMQKNQLHIQKKAEKPWILKGSFNELALFNPQLENLKTTCTMDATLSNENEGAFTFHISQGYIQLPADSPLKKISFQASSISVELTPKALKAQALIPLNNKNKIALSLQNQKNNWQLEGVYSATNDKLHVKGEGLWMPEFKGSFALTGDAFPLIESKEYQIQVSPRLKALLTPQSLDIQGALLIPKAHLKPFNFGHTLLPTEDITFVSEEKKNMPFKVTSAINLQMGNAVDLEFKGLKTTLTGNIMLKQLMDEPLTATGQLTFKKGTYTAFGQDLTIKQGQLLFAGGLVSNPGIQLKAVRIINKSKFSANLPTNTNANRGTNFTETHFQPIQFSTKTTVGVEVSGFLRNPKISLFSSPSHYSQADILSLLVLGFPANLASKSGGQILLAAISSLDLGKDSQATELVKQLKNSLKVDFNIQTNNSPINTTNFTDSTRVVVGKSISKRIYVSYNLGLNQTDPNVLTLKYLLTRFFSLQITTSKSDNGIDFLYVSK